MAKGFRGGMGMGGNMNQVVAQAQRMQRQIELAQAEIQQMEFTGTAGGELVKVVVTGEHKLVKVELAKEIVDPEDIETLQDSIVAALNEAMAKADEASAALMGKMTGGLSF